MKGFELLKSIRQELGWTQEKMAEAIGLGRSYFSQLESGRRPIKDWILDEARDLAVTHMPFEAEAETAQRSTIADTTPVSKQSATFVQCFSENMRAIRGARTQRQFTRLLGLANQATYHRYEAGRIPRPNVLAWIAHRLGIGVDELLSPLSEARIKEIISALEKAAPKREEQPWDDRKKARLALFEKLWELIKPETVEAIRLAFRLSDLTWRELIQTHEHFTTVAAEAEPLMQRFYALITRATSDEIERRRWPKK